MSDVFLSYASEDQQRVGPLVRALGAAGLDVFWDRSIRPGEDWRITLEREINQAGCVLAIWSVNSVRSRWVCEEAEAGQRASKLLCALIDHVDAPLGFRSEQAVDLRDWDGASHSPPFATLLAAVRKMIGRAAQPPTPKQPPATQPLLEDLRSQGFKQIPGPPGFVFVVQKSTMGGLIPRFVAAVEVGGSLADLETARNTHAFFENWAKSLMGNNGMAFLIFVARSPSAAFVDGVLALGPRLIGGSRVTPYVYDADVRKYWYAQPMLGTQSGARVKFG
jgi:hypothetical protein